MLSRDTATERLLRAKERAGIRFDDLAAAVHGGVSCGEREADRLCTELDIDDPEVRAALQRPPAKGDDDPTVPSDPMLYRLYEVPQVYGDAIRAVVHEEFGDGIMSAIDFECRIDRVEREDGDRVRITYEGKFLPYRKW